MKTYLYTGTFDESKLFDELLALYPGWIIISESGTQCLLSIIATPTGVQLQTPDDADDAVIVAVIDAHDPTAHIPVTPDQVFAARRAFRLLPNWATWTPLEGKSYVQTSVLSGWDKTTVNTWIDTNVTSVATARTALKLLAAALIDLREIVAIVAQAILFLRDIAVR